MSGDIVADEKLEEKYQDPEHLELAKQIEALKNGEPAQIG
jgi:hypothetical protein